MVTTTVSMTVRWQDDDGHEMDKLSVLKPVRT